jgi:hypothetical protein
MAQDPVNPSSNVTVNEYARRLAEQSRTPSEYLVEPKIYFHHHNYAKFHIDLGASRVKTIGFANHKYITDDKREQDQLDMVADMPGTFIYTLPDNDAKHAIEQELQAQLYSSIQQTAQARALSQNQMYDPNVPVIPVNVQHVQGTPMSVYPVGGNVGMQSSVSGTQAVTPLTAKQTRPQEQTLAPAATAAPTNVANPQADFSALLADTSKLAESASLKERTPQEIAADQALADLNAVSKRP